MTKTLGIIGQDRLSLVPISYWPTHEFCFYLHDKMVGLLKEYGSSGVHDVVSVAVNLALEEKKIDLQEDEVLEIMKSQELRDPYKLHFISHNVLALTADMLNYIYEAMRCLEKRKFSVAFSLLRKPLKEHLFFLSWILADEDDYISRFEQNNYISFSGLSKQLRIEIIKKAIDKLYVNNTFDAELIWNLIYSKKHESSFEPIWQRATHLTTSHGDLLKTENYSLNFIFENNSDDYYFNFLSDKLPYLFLYITQVILQSFNRVSPVNEKTTSHLILTMLGCYEAIFLKNSKMEVTKKLKEDLGEFLTCIHCGAKLRATRQNSVYLFIHEFMMCSKCKLRSDVPLYWLLAKANFTI